MGDGDAWLRPLIAPLAEEFGVDVVDAAVKGTGPKRVVRVAVDRKGGIDLGTCQQLSRRLSQVLDEVDPLDSAYELVVTSPGTDRPLSQQRDFDRVEGRLVLVHQTEQDGQVRQVKGMVTAADEEAVVLDVDGDAVRVPYRDIVKATQALPW